MKTALFLLLAVVSAGAGAWGWREAQKVAAKADRAAAFPAKPAVDEKAVKKPDQAALSLASADLPAGPMAEWVRLLAESGPADLPALWQSAEALAPADRPPIRRLIAARWADLDPAGAWTVLHAAEEGAIVLRAWLARAPHAATAEILAKADAVPDPTSRMLLREFPEAYWQLVMKTRRPRLCPGTLEEREWEKLALAHPEEAERLARELPVSPHWKHFENGAEMVVITLAKARAQRDPHAALAWAKGLPEGQQERAREEIIPRLALSDPETAARLIGPKNSEFDSIILAVADLFAKTDPKAALAWLGRFADSKEIVNGDMEIGRAAEKIAATGLSEGRLTLEEVLKVAMDGPFSQIPGVGVGDFLKGAPPATLREAAERLNGKADKMSAAALESVISTWDRSDPAGVGAFVKTLPEGDGSALLGWVLWERTRGGETMNEVLATWGDLPASLRGQAILEALPHLKDGIGSTFERSPGFTESAFAAVIDATGDWDGRLEAVERLCQLWGPVDPRSAMAWALKQADPAAQETGVATVLKEWAAHDSWKASQWLAAQPVGAVRDAGAAALAESLSSEEPDSAWEWAGAISDGTQRQATIDKVTAAWAKLDAEAARNAVDHAAFNPATRQRLSAIIDRAASEPKNPKK